jgi:ADP-heptose:LPS heptosyltransferase
MYRGQLKIGILRALYLGDMLCIIPAVRAIRNFYPGSEIVLIGLPWEAEFVKRFKHYFDRFIEFPGAPEMPEQPYDHRKLDLFIHAIRREKFDLFLQMQGNGLTTNLLCLGLGCEKVVGLRRASDALDDSSFFPISEDTDHEVLRFFKLTERLGIPDRDAHLEFPFTREDITSAEKLLSQASLSPGTYVCIHPGARDPRRRWSPVEFARVADEIVAMGYRIVLTGSEDEAPVLTRVAQLMSYPSINLVEKFGHLPLGTLAYVIDQAALLICNDTGVSHIAAALEVPSVVIFSPHSDPARWAPLRSDLHKAIVPHLASAGDEVMQAIKEALTIPVGA